MPAPSGQTLIRSDATYLITGGVGGLGRSMTKWLVQQGAKFIILASRSGLANSNAQALLEEFKDSNVTIDIRQCNVGSEEQVQKLVVEGSLAFPPIRGVIHGAMVLHVCSFFPLFLACASLFRFWFTDFV